VPEDLPVGERDCRRRRRRRNWWSLRSDPLRR
jgi:hypothetical protein